MFNKGFAWGRRDAETAGRFFTSSANNLMVCDAVGDSHTDEGLLSSIAFDDCHSFSFGETVASMVLHSSGRIGHGRNFAIPGATVEDGFSDNATSQVAKARARKSPLLYFALGTNMRADGATPAAAWAKCRAVLESFRLDALGSGRPLQVILRGAMPVNTTDANLRLSENLWGQEFDSYLAAYADQYGFVFVNVYSFLSTTGDYSASSVMKPEFAASPFDQYHPAAAGYKEIGYRAALALVPYLSPSVPWYLSMAARVPSAGNTGTAYQVLRQDKFDPRNLLHTGSIDDSNRVLNVGGELMDRFVWSHYLTGTGISHQAMTGTDYQQVTINTASAGVKDVFRFRVINYDSKTDWDTVNPGDVLAFIQEFRFVGTPSNVRFSAWVRTNNNADGSGNNDGRDIYDLRENHSFADPLKWATVVNIGTVPAGRLSLDSYVRFYNNDASPMSAVLQYKAPKIVNLTRWGLNP